MNVDVKCEITEIVQDIYSKYQFGVISCNYTDSIKKFLQIVNNHNPFPCEKICDNTSIILCQRPFNISVNSQYLSWEDVSSYIGNYRLEILDLDNNVIYNSSITFEEYEEGNYRTNIINFNLENKAYKFLLYKNCEEGIENGPATGCASILSLPLFISEVTNNTGYEVLIEFPGLVITSGTLTASLYKEGIFQEDIIVTGDLIIGELTPETDYYIDFKYQLGPLDSCPLPSLSFRTYSNPFKYYRGNMLGCQDCEEQEEIILRISSSENLIIGDNYITLSNELVIIKEQVYFEETEFEEITYFVPILCDTYCICGVAININTNSVNSVENICGVATNINTQCLNCE